MKYVRFGYYNKDNISGSTPSSPSRSASVRKSAPNERAEMRQNFAQTALFESVSDFAAAWKACSSAFPRASRTAFSLSIGPSRLLQSYSR